VNTFVILAAGRGTRIGRVGAELHKALVPLDNQAVLSHLFELAPPGAKIVICLGHRGPQIRDYVALAYPNKRVTFVDVPGWDQPGGGPGASLLAAREHVEGDLTFTSCDTLWSKDLRIWQLESSWAAVAPIPAGTTGQRWCRMNVRERDSRIVNILDKETGYATQAYTGLAHIKARHLSAFWNGVAATRAVGVLVEGETQVTGGFRALLEDEQLHAVRISWIDVGDEAAYRSAVVRMSGYDWIKPGQATYIIPSSGRVVKFFANPEIVRARVRRGVALKDRVPQPIQLALDEQMFAYPYVPGVTGYEAADKFGPQFIEHVVRWAHGFTSLPASAFSPSIATVRSAAQAFYLDKTSARISMLPADLQRIANDVMGRVPWLDVFDGVYPGVFHGDLNFGNIVWADDGLPPLKGIDWRENFGPVSDWGDLRYDRAKLMAGCVVHWENARVGDFRPWSEGPRYLQMFRDAWQDSTVEIIAALSLFNSAPLHAAPLDEILVVRGAAWLQEVLK